MYTNRIKKSLTKQEVNTSKLIDYLSYLSQKYDIKLENFKPISSIKKTWFYCTTVKITIMGSYSNIFSFTKSISNLPYFITLQNFELTKIRKSRLKLTTTLIIYNETK